MIRKRNKVRDAIEPRGCTLGGSRDRVAAAVFQPAAMPNGLRSTGVKFDPVTGDAIWSPPAAMPTEVAEAATPVQLSDGGPAWVRRRRLSARAC